MPDINYISAIVAIVVGFSVGFIWYGPLFGRRWQNMTGFSDYDIQHQKSPGVFERLLLHAVGLVVSVFVLSFFVLRNNASNFLEGAQTGFLVWVIGAIILVLTGAMHDDSQHRNVHVLLIDLGHWFVVFVLMGGVLAVL